MYAFRNSVLPALCAVRVLGPGGVREVRRVLLLWRIPTGLLGAGGYETETGTKHLSISARSQPLPSSQPPQLPSTSHGSTRIHSRAHTEGLPRHLSPVFPPFVHSEDGPSPRWFSSAVPPALRQVVRDAVTGGLRGLASWPAQFTMPRGVGWPAAKV